jgi:hypothetical protein
MTRTLHVLRILAFCACPMLAAVTLLADDPLPLLWEDTGGFKKIDSSPGHSGSKQLLIHHRNRFRAASAAAAMTQDVGDVAVVVDNGAIIVPPVDIHPFDLAVPASVVFTPALAGYSVAFAAPSLDPNLGVTLPLGDDDTEEVALGFAFPFLGVSYASVWVNSDGNLTLGQGDSASSERDAARLIGGPPRIAPFLADLDPTTGGTVSAHVSADRVVVTWSGVPEFGLTNVNTFQATLRSNGAITFAYSRMDAQFGVIGVAEGHDEGPLNEIDLTADLPGAFGAGAIFEEFFPGHGTLVDPVELSKAFYRTHDDKFDFLVAFTDFPPDLGGSILAYEVTIRNDTLGIGFETRDFSSAWGSTGELESFLMMNAVDLYWPDELKLVDPPIEMFRFPGGASNSLPPGPDHISRRARRMGTIAHDPVRGPGSYNLGLNSPISILAHETFHRWAAFVPFIHPTKGIGIDSLDLLDSGLAHWSFLVNTTVPAAQFGGDPRTSSLQGNSIIDLNGNFFCVKPGETSFLTARNELVDGYTALDQYLMGLRQANEVGPFWYIDEPTQPFSGASFENIRSAFAVDDVGLCGKRVNLTVQNIRNFPGVGPRVPAIGDEVDHDATGTPQLDHKTMAFVLLVQPSDPASHAAAIQHVDNFRRVWQTYANGPATGGRGRFDTVLNPAIY